MEIISFEKKAFEEVAAKLDYFVRRMDNLCRLHGEKKAGIWRTIMPSAKNCASVREHCRRSVTTALLPLARLATAPTTARKMWSGLLWMWRRGGRKRNGKAKAFDSWNITKKTNRMGNEIRETDHEWVRNFHSNFDRLLASFEKLFSQRQPSVYGDELLTDKEVSHLLKVSRRTLQDYRNNGILSYIQVGGKILYRASDIERTLMDGYRESYRSKK